MLGYLAGVQYRRDAVLTVTPLPAAPVGPDSRADDVIASCPPPQPFGPDCKGFHSYVQQLKSWVFDRGFEWPRSYSDRAAAARFQDDAWVRAYVRRQILRKDEEACRAANLVSCARDQFCTGLARSVVAEAAASFLAYAEKTQMYSSAGRSARLVDLVNSGTANLKNRRCELMTRISGLERIATSRGWVALFATMTLPGRMHRALWPSGRANPKWDQSTVRQCQAQLMRQWVLMRASLADSGVEYFGVRVAEPHHDGTPHWHLLFFVRPDHRQELVRQFYRVGVMGSELDPDCGEHRAEIVDIDPDRLNAKGERCSATGYVAKYVSKNIDGLHTDGAEKAAAVRAWASTFGVRQFQFFGAGSVQVWREARRLGDDVAGQLGLIRDRAKANDYAGFFAELEKTPVSLVRDASTVNGFGESIPGRVLGLECGDEAAQTRHERWAASAVAAAEPLPWTRKNNCKSTVLDDEDMDAAFDDRTDLDLESGWSEPPDFSNLERAGALDTSFNLRQ